MGTGFVIDLDEDDDGIPDAVEAGDDDLFSPPVDTDGDTIPDFTALDEFGQTFDSSALAGHPVLIKFFRAHW